MKTVKQGPWPRPQSPGCWAPRPLAFQPLRLVTHRKPCSVWEEGQKGRTQAQRKPSDFSTSTIPPSQLSC